MKKSTLLIIVALVATSAVPAVKSLRNSVTQNTPDNEISSTTHLFPVSTKNTKEEKNEEEKAISRNKKKMDKLSEEFRKDMIKGKSFKSQERRLYVGIIKLLLSGKSYKDLLEEPIIFPQGKNSPIFKAMATRLEQAYSRYSPSIRLLGGPKIFSSRDQARTLVAAIISNPSQNPEDKTRETLQKAAKIFLETESQAKNLKKTFSLKTLKERTYDKTCEELAKSFKNPENQRSIIQFIQTLDQGKHQAQHKIQRLLSKENNLEFNQIWDELSDIKNQKLKAENDTLKAENEKLKKMIRIKTQRKRA